MGGGAGGSGGSIRIEGESIALGAVSAVGGTGGNYSNSPGHGGDGRIAIYYTSSQAITSMYPASQYIQAFSLTQPATATPLPTPISFSTPSPWGSGNDGDLTVSSFNINTNVSNGRTCPDGISYSLIELNDASAKLSGIPGPNCLVAGDEVLILHVKGSGTNIGTYEFLKVGGVVNNTVYFTTAKLNNYGNGETDSGSGIGVDQIVMLQRVPNYRNVTVDGTLTANVFDGSKYGVVAFRVSNLLR